VSGYTTTPNLGLRKPNNHGDNDQWGADWNVNADTLDAAHGAGGGIPDAPSDGQVYGRRGSTASWVVATGGVPPGPPALGGPPAISGNGVVGQTLSCTTGNWTNIPTGYGYQWQRDGVNIGGATASTYVLVDADGNHAVRCQVTASNSVGSGTLTTNTINVLPSFVFPVGMAAIYSTRRTVQAYAGACLRVRRFSDNTTLDVGFVGSNFDYASAAAFIAGSGNVVERWFDQSGNGRDMIQTSGPTPNEFRPALIIIGTQAYVCFEGQFMQTASAVAVNADHTIGFVGWSGSGNANQIPISDFDGTNGWFLQLNHATVKRPAYFTSGASYMDATSGNACAKAPMRMSVSRAGGTVAINLNGVSLPLVTNTGASNGAPTAPMALAGYNNGNPSFQGLLSEVYVYASALSSATLAQIDLDESVYWQDPGFLTPYATGCGIVQVDASNQLHFGNILQYDQGQPWTAYGAFQAYGQCTNAEVLFTNATPDGHATCYEFWLDLNGAFRVRLINDYVSNLFLGVIGTPTASALDGKKHMMVATYDGTSPATPASIKIYLDGVALPTTTEFNNLGTLSIVAPGQDFAIGMQMPGGANMRGPVSFFQLDKVARSAAYIAPLHSGVLPANDPTNTVLRCRFTEGTGVATIDESTNHFSGTLSTPGIWLP
jgi:hypothetical protein